MKVYSDNAPSWVATSATVLFCLGISDIANADDTLWADRFLVTPADGIQDFYGSFIANIYGAKFTAVYHHLESDNDSYDYGDEIDLLLTKTFKEHHTLGLKCAHYDADGNPTNLGRNPTQSTDTTKFWVFGQIKFGTQHVQLYVGGIQLHHWHVGPKRPSMPRQHIVH